MRMLRSISGKPAFFAFFRRRFKLVLLIGACVAALVVGFAILSLSPAQHPRSEARIAQGLEAQIAQGVAIAQASNQQAARQAIASINRYFNKIEARKFHRFVNDTDSWSITGDAIEDVMPWSSGHNVHHYLAKKFSQHVLSQKTLDQQLKDVESIFIHREASADNLLRRRWIEDFKSRIANGDMPSSMHIHALISRCWKAATTAQINAVGGVANGRIIAGGAANAAGIVVGLGVAATADVSILGVGAATAPETLGLSLALGAVAMIGTKVIYDAVANPSAKVRKSVVAALEKVRKKLLYANTKGVGLIAIFELAANQNSKLCQVAAKNVIHTLNKGI